MQTIHSPAVSSRGYCYECRAPISLPTISRLVSTHQPVDSETQSIEGCFSRLRSAKQNFGDETVSKFNQHPHTQQLSNDWGLPYSLPRDTQSFDGSAELCGPFRIRPRQRLEHCSHPRKPDDKLECLPHAKLIAKGSYAYFVSVRDERKPTQTE